MNNSNSDLVFNLKNGCKNAFEKIYYLHHKKVYGFCIKYGLNQLDAEEITQEVFVKLWENRVKIDPEKNLNNYILTISKNVIIDGIKKNIKSQATKEYQMNFLKPVNNVELHMDYSELQETLKDTLTRLPERRREIFEMSRMKGLSNKEIAKTLGITVKTVENQLTLALHEFRSAFGNSKVGYTVTFLSMIQLFLKF